VLRIDPWTLRCSLIAHFALRPWPWGRAANAYETVPDFLLIFGFQTSSLLAVLSVL
jgi:hypothetical protein